MSNAISYIIRASRARIGNPVDRFTDLVGPFACVQDATRYGQAFKALWRDEGGDYEIVPMWRPEETTLGHHV